MITTRGYMYALACVASIATANGFTGTAFVPNGMGKTSFTANDPLKPTATSPINKLNMATVADPETSSSTTGSSALEDYVKSRGGNLPIKKVLIANNGMAATKSILSMRNWAYMELGDDRAIQFVAMATPEDLKANAEFIRLADSFVEVPGGVNRNNYANVEVISKIAKEQGVDAVWPGWGHASENPNLPRTLNALGIKFIGPPAPVMSVLGDKIAANILAQTAKVPSIPWSGSFGADEDDGPLQANLNEEGTIPDEIFEKATCRNVEEAVEAAKRIGYENGVMIKASEGGGGKGIRFVENEDDLRNAYIQVQNEVVGSPIFIMQLCKNARHLEVQIVGDEHGNAVALNGRDCSTQRRFQKIFEEGPPVIAPRETFREMEKAAQRLTQNIGYVGAGTVEYLFNADTGKFFFLELNPRLQVEHPVTEGITGVNLPATQLQVAMGIPLYNIPQVRAMYGREMYGTGAIDFLEEDYKPIETHVIAARITAENPDEGFKPTAGSIERIKFQSTSNVWGYFSVGSNGGIHEFADSQFGHLFAKGPNREQARKALVMALKEIEVRGEIRTTVEYLVELLETEAFKENTIDTSWLDGIIKDKSVQLDKPPHLVVSGAAIFKAFEHVRVETANVFESFQKGQVGTGDIPTINSFNIEVAYLDIKYGFHVERLATDIYRFTNSEGFSFDARVTLTAEGALLASYGGETHRIVGMEEPLGLRLNYDGVTILMPNIFDPSELRTDVTGKVVRYLQEPGTDVEVGQPYVEVEAMKMIMPFKATESGKITPALSPGSVISAGDLLATLQLKDPSKVKKIGTHEGDLDIGDTTLDVPAKDELMHVMQGYKNDPEAVALAAIAECADLESATALATDMINEFVRVEKTYDGLLIDDVVRDLVKADGADLGTVVDSINAHQQVALRARAIGAILRFVQEFPTKFDAHDLSEELEAALSDLSSLKGREYGELTLASSAIIRESKVPPFDTRVAELRDVLLDPETDNIELSKSTGLSAGVELLTELIRDEDIKVRAAAIETYVRRVYRTYRIIDLDVSEKNGRLSCTWSFKFMDVPPSKTVTRKGLLTIIPSMGDFDASLPDIMQDASEAFTGDVDPASGPVNVLHIYSSDTNAEFEGEDIEKALAKKEGELKLIGTRIIYAMKPVPGKSPKYFSFLQCDGFKEDTSRRDMRPTFHYLLELSRLRKNFELTRLDAVGKNAQVYLGTEPPKPGRKMSPQVVFVRGISHTPGLISYTGARRALLQGLDELERAQANSKVLTSSSSRIFLHSLPELEGISPNEIAEVFAENMGKLKSRLAQRLLKLRVDEIEVKIRVQDKAENGEPVITPVRLIASSMEGEWLKTVAYVERPDPVTGVTQEFCVLGDEQICMLDPYDSSNLVQVKRAIARRVGSTYAYDFLGLLEVGLIGEWDAYARSFTRMGLEAPTSIPSDIFKATELIPQDDGSLAPGTRQIGSNKVGMLAWQVIMKTPEYPEGREVVLIANDVTVQSGSFGVVEDELFYKASEYARDRKLPRVYISCNSGARIGLVDDLKPKLKIKFNDENNPTKGFEYLYLLDEDYNELPEGAVIAHKVPEGWALDDVIGTNHGIGVENLQGSGKIAGETSRAYDEIFTLSLVTGRSVGIGAYLVRLGQRVIQMKQGPIILTGFSALNKLLGREVYNSQDQLGGPQIMIPNGVSHELVDDDQEGVESILKWLSFVPKNVGALPASRGFSDPITREVEWRPSSTPYDPRMMMNGDGKLKGFFDDGSWKEYLSGWGKSVVIGRARLGGIPMGVVSVETRLVDKVVPADPADPNSREAILPQAGQVLFPDSSYKTAQAIRDFNNEGLPIMLFANWRGFSGGSRDMAGEILKYGAMIVDALREYKHPVFIYLPPHSELRGGSWVVVDPTINIEKMEMYADPDSRGGILEPAGIIEVKFRDPDQVKLMHKVDPQLKLLDSELELSELDTDAQEDIKNQIKAREELIKPVYTQVATEFADLHDKTGRMKAKGVIKSAVSWSNSREFFYYLTKRRILQDSLVSQLKDADSSLTTDAAIKILQDMCPAEWDDNHAVLGYFEDEASSVAASIQQIKTAAIKAKIDALNAELNNL